MKLTLLKNPYTTVEGAEPTHHLQVNIGQTDWMRLYKTLPFHGVQDSFLATLFSKFIELADSELPEKYDLDSEEIIVNIVNRLNLKKK